TAPTGGQAPTTRCTGTACCARSTTAPASRAGATTCTAAPAPPARPRPPAGGGTVTGDSANSAIALRTSDGSTLWHSGIGRVGNSPVTYELDGRQYAVRGGGSALYSFALPQTHWRAC